MESINAIQGFLHEVDQSHVLDCVLRLYDNQVSSIILEYPLYIKFTGEVGVDEDGIQRDTFSAFWEEHYSKLFEGLTTFVPMVYPQIGMLQCVTMDRIISHGYRNTPR